MSAGDDAMAATKLGFLGAGQMAAAIIGGVLRAGLVYGPAPRAQGTHAGRDAG